MIPLGEFARLTVTIPRRRHRRQHASQSDGPWSSQRGAHFGGQRV